MPALHTSLVHELPSSAQGLVLLVCWQPTAELHASLVQALPSSQLTVLCWQPSVGSQLSAVQALESLQSSAVPLWQPRVRLQISEPLQTCPSSQARLFAWCVQALVASLQASCVQETPSLQATGVPATQLPETHCSVPLQNAPSSHCALLVHAVAKPRSSTSSTRKPVKLFRIESMVSNPKRTRTLAEGTPASSELRSFSVACQTPLPSSSAPPPLLLLATVVNAPSLTDTWTVALSKLERRSVRRK